LHRRPLRISSGGADVDRARLAKTLRQRPDAADESNAVKDPGAAASDIRLGHDASETAVKRATLTDDRHLLFCDHGVAPAM
jgi:hypothetical protein